jgi:hypothetical protein
MSHSCHGGGFRNERFAVIERAVGIGHNGGPPLDEPEDQKKKKRQQDRPKWRLTKAKVAERYGVVPRTIERWSENPTLGFPQPVIVNKRPYWDEFELEALDISRVRKTIQTKTPEEA